MAMRFTTAGESVIGNGFKCLVYGPSGVGKTTLCATAPRPLIISSEAGLLSIAREYPDLPVIEIKCLADLAEAFNFVATDKDFMPDIDTICLDSISDIAEAILIDEKKRAKDPRKAYGELGDKMAYYIRAFRDLPGKHTLFTAKQDREKDEATGAMLYGPMMPGKMLTQNLSYFFDEVFNMGVGKTPPPENQEYRFLRTRIDFQFQAKDRSGALDELEEPNLGVVIDKIKKYLKR